MNNIDLSVCEVTGELKTTFNIPIRIPDKNITPKLKKNNKKKKKKK